MVGLYAYAYARHPSKYTRMLFVYGVIKKPGSVRIACQNQLLCVAARTSILRVHRGGGGGGGGGCSCMAFLPKVKNAIPPAANKNVRQHDRDTARRIHLEKLAMTRPSIDSTRGAKYNRVRNNLKRARMQEARFTEVMALLPRVRNATARSVKRNVRQHDRDTARRIQGRITALSFVIYEHEPRHANHEPATTGGTRCPRLHACEPAGRETLRSTSDHMEQQPMEVSKAVVAYAAEPEVLHEAMRARQVEMRLRQEAHRKEREAEKEAERARINEMVSSKATARAHRDL